MISQLLLGVQHIHSGNYTHLNLKPENILITGDFKLRIADASNLSKHTMNEFDFCQIGILNYVGPEMVSGKSYSEKTDIWSIGCIIYEICTL